MPPRRPSAAGPGREKAGPPRFATSFARLPIMVQLALVMALAMLVPSAHAAANADWAVARIFLHSAVGCFLILMLLSIALAGRAPGDRMRGVLPTMLGAYLVLPVMLAIPFAIAVPDTGLFNAWWEMVSSLTTTGATLYAADLLHPTLHLWRSMVGWMGGLFVLTAAIALLAPLNIGGFEILSDTGPTIANDPRDRAQQLQTPSPDNRIRRVSSDPGRRMWRWGLEIAPIYAGLTGALWLGLLILGDPALVALCRAMGTLSTSGISPVEGAAGATGSGMASEALIALFLIPALTRRVWPGGDELRTTPRLIDDPELRMAAVLVLSVTVVLMVRPLLGALGVVAPVETAGGDTPTALGNIARFIEAIWGAAFSALSFLTTAGWTSVHWDGTRAWSGLSAPGLIMAGLAMMGGGVATVAGGVKLLRVYALASHSKRELERIVHPASIAGGGVRARQLRQGGAHLAFIFFMLFAMSLALVVILVTIRPIRLETATILSIAALTNTGPLADAIPLIQSYQADAGSAGAPWGGWGGLTVFTKAVLAGAMVAGRIETLALLAMLSPGLWRR